MIRRVLLVVLAVSFVAMWGVAISSYSALPETFPTHFDADGQPDSFRRKSLGGWLALPIAFTALSVAFAGFARLTRHLASRYASVVDVPEKETFVALSEEARLRAVAPLVDLSYAMPLALLWLCVYLQFGSVLVARGEARSLPSWPLGLVLVFSFAALAISIVRTRKAILAERG